MPTRISPGDSGSGNSGEPGPEARGGPLAHVDRGSSPRDSGPLLQVFGEPHLRRALYARTHHRLAQVIRSRQLLRPGGAGGAEAKDDHVRIVGVALDGWLRQPVLLLSALVR